MICLTEVNLCLVKGQNKAYNLSFRNGDNTALDITDATITMTVKRNLTDATSIFTSEATITDGANGKATITLSAEDTDKDLGDYYYDIWIESDSIPAIPIQKGKLSIGWRVKDE